MCSSRSSYKLSSLESSSMFQLYDPSSRKPDTWIQITEKSCGITENQVQDLCNTRNRFWHKHCKHNTEWGVRLGVMQGRVKETNLEGGKVELQSRFNKGSNFQCLPSLDSRCFWREGTCKSNASAPTLQRAEEMVSWWEWGQAKQDTIFNTGWK